jgi:hypothetical protein
VREEQEQDLEAGGGGGGGGGGDGSGSQRTEKQAVETWSKKPVIETGHAHAKADDFLGVEDAIGVARLEFFHNTIFGLDHFDPGGQISSQNRHGVDKTTHECTTFGAM